MPWAGCAGCSTTRPTTPTVASLTEEEELAIATERPGACRADRCGHAKVNRKVGDPNNPVAQLMRTESALNDEEMGVLAKPMGPTCLGCPDCGPVMGDATYEAMFGKQQDGV